MEGTMTAKTSRRGPLLHIVVGVAASLGVGSVLPLWAVPDGLKPLMIVPAGTVIETDGRTLGNLFEVLQHQASLTRSHHDLVGYVKSHAGLDNLGLGLALVVAGCCAGLFV